MEKLTLLAYASLNGDIIPFCGARGAKISKEEYRGKKN
jgi:hypothetical protein